MTERFCGDPTVTVFPVAASDRFGRASCCLMSNEVMNSLLPTATSDGVYDGVRRQETIKVKTEMIDA